MRKKRPEGRLAFLSSQSGEVDPEMTATVIFAEIDLAIGSSGRAGEVKTIALDGEAGCHGAKVAHAVLRCFEEPANPVATQSEHAPVRRSREHPDIGQQCLLRGCLLYTSRRG